MHKFTQPEPRIGHKNDEIKEDDLVEKLGRTIRQLRLARGLTPYEFAGDIFCTPSFLLRLEDGRIDPDLRIIERCASALQMQISELLLAATIDIESVVIAPAAASEVKQ